MVQTSKSLGKSNWINQIEDKEPEFIILYKTTFLPDFLQVASHTEA